MSEPARKSRRAGGRSARHVARASALPDDIKPVKPGFEGGQYKPLSEAEVQKVHQGAMDVLANIGMGEVPDVLIEKATELGCTYDDRGRLLFSQSFATSLAMPTAFILNLLAIRLPEYQATLVQSATVISGMGSLVLNFYIYPKVALSETRGTGYRHRSID